MVLSRGMKTCPPGVFCITPGILVLLTIFAVAVIFLISQKYQNQPMMLERAMPPPQPIQVAISAPQGGDDRYSRPPRPQRYWDNGPEFPPRGALVASDGSYILNEPTRGLPRGLPIYGRSENR